MGFPLCSTVALACHFLMARWVCVTGATPRWAQFPGPRLREYVFARMKAWKILRDCRIKGDGVHHAMLGIERMHNLTLAG